MITGSLVLHHFKQTRIWLLPTRLIKQNKMIQSPPSVPSDTLSSLNRPQSHRKIHTQQSQTTLQSKPKSDVFMLRFKNNQHTLKSKFQKLLADQSNSPSMNIRFNHSFLEDVEKVDRRSIQREKEELRQELSQSMNETKYYQRKSEEFQKTCSFLERKVRKIEEVRRNRRSEVTKLEHDLQSISESIRHEKSRYYNSIKSSKQTSKKNRILCELKKCSQADTIRHQSYLHQQQIQEQKQAMKELNQSRYKLIAECERNASLSVSMCIQKKQKGAEEFKLQRLFRQLKEKQQIKIECARARMQNNQVAEYKQKTIDLEEKIKKYRETLGERVFVAAKQSRVNLHNRSRTQENQGSVKSGFLSGKKGIYEDQSFDD